MSDSELTRRKFIQAGAALTFVVMLEPFGCKRKVGGDQTASDQAVEQPPATPGARQAVGAWVVLHEDGSVLIYNPAAEMGQGSMSALAALIADEMDADWDKVRVEHSPVDPQVYGRSWGRSTGGGTMMTVGSHTVPGYYRKLRLAGAQIRKALIAGAAAAMELPAAELTTEPGAVVHGSGKRITYGELAALDTVPGDLPPATDDDLKPKSQLRLVGANAPRTDIPSKTDGSAQFAIDVQLPGMLYGTIVRSPVPNGSVRTHNAAAVRGLSGVETTVELDHGVGIIATSMEELFAAREQLEVQWSEGAAAGFDSAEALAAYPSQIDSVSPRSLGSLGDAGAAQRRAKKTFAADYYADHIYHAQMEPLNSVAHVHESGDAEVWVGTQAPGRARSAVARSLGVDESQVTLHRYLLGGGFGRRSEADYVVEAVLLARSVDKPVKLIWTREDDLQYGKFRPMCLQRMTAGVDDDGKLVSWRHQLVGEGGHLLASGADIAYYDVPNQSIELHEVDHGLRLHYWRAVGHGYNKFATEALIDQVAASLGVDPVEYRLRMISDARMQRTLELVAEMSDWGSTPPAGRARGVAIGERSNSMAAGVAEVSVDRSTGELRVHKFWAALDAGIIVQPDNAVAQIEGSIVMGLGTVLTERITLKNGRVQQSNFHDYPILRMSQTPEIDVRFVDSDGPPTGVGEPGVPIVPGAVANAFARLTGKHLRHLPFTRDRVKSVL